MADTYSWACYAETIFERELWALQHICPKKYENQKDVIENYLQDRLKEVKEITGDPQTRD